MELLSKLRWVIVVLIAFSVMLLFGWGISVLISSFFNDSSTPTASQTSQINESQSLEVTAARYIVEGPVVASTEHRRVEVEVTPDTVSMTIYSNYGQDKLIQKTYSNNPVSYQNFIKSLEYSNASVRFEGTDEEDDNNDIGICSLGLRYILELGDYIRRWTTSCNRNEGTSAGRMATMRGLFKNQVPDFNEVMKSVPNPRPQW
jgi:hypothetical protein